MWLFHSLFKKSEPKQERKSSLPPPPSDFTRRIQVDPDLYHAHSDIINTNTSIRHTESLEPQKILTGTEWRLYRQHISMELVKEILSTTNKRRLCLIKFSKCTFEPGVFTYLIESLSNQSEDIRRTINVCFDGYLHEVERNDHVDPVLPFLPFSDIIKVVKDSTSCVHRFSFMRCYLPQYKFLTLIRACNDRTTNNQEAYVHMSFQFDAENVINREPIVYRELIQVISNVSWVPHLHAQSDIPFIEVKTDREYYQYHSLSKFYGKDEPTTSQVAVRRPKMDLEIRFVYFSETVWKFRAKPSCEVDNDFLKEINTVIKELHKDHLDTVSD